MKAVVIDGVLSVTFFIISTIVRIIPIPGKTLPNHHFSPHKIHLTMNAKDKEASIDALFAEWPV